MCNETIEKINIFIFSFIRSYHRVLHLLPRSSSNALNQNLDSRPGLVDHSLDSAGRGVESTGSASGQLVSVGVGNHASAIRIIVAGSVGVV